MFTGTTTKKAARLLQKITCIFLASIIAMWMVPTTSKALAANEDKPNAVYMQISGKSERTNVMKQVANLDANMGKGTTIQFEIDDAYNSVASADKRHTLVFEDSSGGKTQLNQNLGSTCTITSDQLVVDRKLKLVCETKDSSGNFVKRYEQQLNVRVIDTKSAEQKPSGSNAGSVAGMSQDGSTWSFTNGLEIELKGTGFKFLDNTKINLGSMMLPLMYKHNPDGTTVVGINCDPNNQQFYQAVKNGNVWQKYTSDKMTEMTKQMDRGWSGKSFGKWGGKAFDWNVMGYMEFNTKDPSAPRAVNLIISMGVKAEGHAQYLCFTGTLSFSVGGKATLTGKLTPAKGLEGKFNIGAYGALELYIGLGLNYVASIGTFGKGQINVDFQVLPAVKLDTVKLSGSFGVKAKVFGFTLFSWTILSGDKQLYPKEGSNNLKAQSEENPFLSIDADAAYPPDSRAYLDSGGALAAQASTSSSTILQGIYDQTELSCVTTNEGPVIVYIADAKQIDPDSTRDANNRSAVAYTRYVNGSWTNPVIIDTADNFADYSPTITSDGENCYVAWLAADSAIGDGASLADVGNKLDVKIATISKDGSIAVETVCEESSEPGTMPASPKALQVGNNLYVGWYTNQTSGSSGEVIGASGDHAFRLYSRDTTTAGTWSKVNEATGMSGAVTSFDIGQFGDNVSCAWSIDSDLYSSEETSLNGASTLDDSTAYYMTSQGGGATELAQQATNTQFAKDSGEDILTYAVLIDADDGISDPYVSIKSMSAPDAVAETVLDGAKVNLPTPFYELAGDLGVGRAGNVSFLKSGDGTCDIQALVTTGAGSADWTSIVEPTADTATITDYCATYADGKPLFIYTTENTSSADGDALGAQAEDDGSVNMNQSTDESLKHLSINDIDYDEYEVTSGGNMPVTVYFNNDGLLDVDGVELWKLENGEATKIASSDNAVAMDNEGSIETTYVLPAASEFTEPRSFTLYAAPAGATVTAEKISRELAGESAMNVTLGAASLSLQTEHQVVDGQESIVATVKNDGIVPHGADLIFIDSDTGETLTSMSVPELGENETYTETYNAPNGYFQKDGIKNIIVTLENDGTQYDGYEINNTQFVSTWDFIEDEATPAASEAEDSDSTSAKAGTPLVKTGDQTTLGLTIAFLALFLVGSLVAVRAAEEARMR